MKSFMSRTPQKMDNINTVDELTEDIGKVPEEVVKYKHKSKNEISYEVKREYSKSSFDRFGDDLAEQILSYLWIKDKFRFECLSKRIQSLIYNKQTKLIITYDNFVSDKKSREMIPFKYMANVNQIESVFTKLQALTDIKMSKCHDTSLLLFLDYTVTLLAHNCQHLNSLIIRHINLRIVSEETIDYFGERCGERIKVLRIDWNSSYNCIDRMLSSMPNLERLTTFSMSSILNGRHKGKIFNTSNQRATKLPKLKYARFKYFPEEYELKQFADEYAHIGVALRLDCDFILKDVSFDRLTSLQYLTADLDHNEPRAIQRMAIHCRHLRCLKMNINLNNAMDGFLRVIGQLRLLKRLMLRIVSKRKPYEQNNYGSVADLRAITGLKRLSLFIDINDQTLVDIDKHLPQLESLSFRIIERMNEKTLESISKLNYLKAIFIEVSLLFGTDKILLESDVIHLLKSRRLRRFKFDNLNNCFNPIDITIRSLNNFAKKAQLYPKVNYYFSLRYTKQFNVLPFLEWIPPNLYINIT